MSHINLDEIKAAFAKQEIMLREIYEKGITAYCAGIVDLNNAFILKDLAVRCIDEGTPGGIHLAGSGILLNVDKAAEILQKAGVNQIYSHEECGAAGLYARNNNLDLDQADEYGKKFAKDLAAKMGISYQGHLEIDQMSRPSGLHIARVVYYDGTGKFDYASNLQLPQGFVISRRFISRDYAIEELKISIDIATGDHGFGSMIDSENPFLIVAIGDAENQEYSLNNLQQELGEVVLAYPKKVKLDGFTALV